MFDGGPGAARRLQELRDVPELQTPLRQPTFRSLESYVLALHRRDDLSALS